MANKETVKQTIYRITAAQTTDCAPTPRIVEIYGGERSCAQLIFKVCEAEFWKATQQCSGCRYESTPKNGPPCSMCCRVGNDLYVEKKGME